MSDDENMPTASQNGVQNLVAGSDENLENSKNENDQNKVEKIQDENVDSENCPGGNGLAKFESKTKLKVTIQTWNGVASWKWIANDDTCGICRVAFDGCCPDCKLPGDDCPLVWGACTHCFHIHCIMKWLNAQQAQHLCPMCRQDWKFKES